MLNYNRFHEIAWDILSKSFKPSEVDNALYSFATNQWSCRDLELLVISNKRFNKAVYKEYLEEYYREVICL